MKIDQTTGLSLHPSKTWKCNEPYFDLMAILFRTWQKFIVRAGWSYISGPPSQVTRGHNCTCGRLFLVFMSSSMEIFLAAPRARSKRILNSSKEMNEANSMFINVGCDWGEARQLRKAELRCGDHKFTTAPRPPRARWWNWKATNCLRPRRPSEDGGRGRWSGDRGARKGCWQVAPPIANEGGI